MCIRAMNKTILVSACLLGCPCRYDGSHNQVSALIDLKKFYNIIPICPEELGGLPTPRLPSEIKDINGKKYVMDKDGEDITKEFNKGAQETLEIAKGNECKIAILKSKSPSCGFGEIYNGSFEKKLVPGRGITAQLLYNNGIHICNEENYPWKIKEILLKL